MSLSLQDLFPSSFSVNDCIKNSSLPELFDVDMDYSVDLSIKIKKGPDERVDPSNTTSFPIEIDDLARLYYLCVSRKVTTVLEFGTGKSSVVLAQALALNKCQHSDFVGNNLRRTNPFELHVIENYSSWIEVVRSQFPVSLLPIVSFHLCNLQIGSFSDRLCTYYWGMPDICPDLIYLDGPDQFSPEGDLRGLSTRHKDRMAMAADILTIEHFLQPGTLIVVDGRTANSRFLKANFQRNWAHFYSPEFDQHFFELQEEPLGQFNKEMLDYCLGRPYLHRILH